MIKTRKIREVFHAKNGDFDNLDLVIVFKDDNFIVVKNFN